MAVSTSHRGGRQVDFSTGDVRRNILDVAAPMLVAQVLNLLYNIVDRIYIGKIPGEGTLALAGLGLCFPIVTLVTAFANLFGVGGAPLCSIARGQKDDKTAGKIMANAYFMLVVCGLVLTVVGLVFHKPVLYLFGASDETYRYAADYMTIYLLGTVFVMTSLGLNPYINSQGFARIGMLTVLLGAAANIVLDPLLIYGLGMGGGGRPSLRWCPKGCRRCGCCGSSRGPRPNCASNSTASAPTGPASGASRRWAPPALSCPSPTVWCRWPAMPRCAPSAGICTSAS